MFSAEDIEKIILGVEKRNNSLENEIRIQRKEGQRVFVIAGSNHLLQKPNFPSCQNVKNALYEDKFIMITRKDLFKTAKPHNKDLKKVKLT